MYVGGAERFQESRRVEDSRGATVKKNLIMIPELLKGEEGR